MKNTPDISRYSGAAEVSRAGVLAAAASSALAVPVLAIDPLVPDDVINFAEAEEEIAVSGTSSLNNALVTLTLGSQTFTTQTGAGGDWQLTIPAHTLSARDGSFPDGTYPLVAEAADGDGNPVSATRELRINADPDSLPSLSGGLDNILTGAEHQVAQAIYGTAQNVEAGQVVTVSLNEKSYTAVVQADGSWSLIIPAADIAALPNGANILLADVTDSAGNPAETVINRFAVEDTLDGIAIDTLAGDNRLNAQEAQSDITVQGASSNLAQGTPVTLTLGGQSYSTTVAADGRWSVTVPAADLQALPDGPVTAEVTALNATGDPLADSLPLGVHTHALPEVTIDYPIPVNIERAQQDQILTGTASVSGDNQTVSVTFDGQIYQGQVGSNGIWHVTLPAGALQTLTDGNYPLTASVTDEAGNSSSATSQLEVDVTAPTLTLDPVTGDDALDRAELLAGITLTGHSDELGTSVFVTFNGNNYYGSVDGDGLWNVVLSAAALNGLAPGSYTLTARVGDGFLNETLVSREITVEESNLPLLTIDPFTGDNELNSAERGVAQELTGTTTHVEAGQTVTVTFNDKSYTTTVEADGSWRLIVPQADLAELGVVRPNYDLTATVSNAGGESVSATEEVTVVTGRTAVAIGIVAGDNQLDTAAAANNLTVSGVVIGVPADNVVTVTLNGQSYTTLVQSDNTWSLQIPAGDLADLSNGTYTLTADALDTNTVPVTDTLDLRVAFDAFRLDPLTEDNILNAEEAANDIIISGHAPVSAQGGSVAVTAFDDPAYHYTGTVAADGTWQVTVPAGSFSGVANGVYTLVAELTAPDGSVTTASHSVTFTPQPFSGGFVFYPFAGDDVVDAGEQAQDQILDGTFFLDDSPTGEGVAGLAVTIRMTSLDGQSFTYTTTTGIGGNWQVTVPAADLALLPDGRVDLAGSVTDGAGNTISNDNVFVVLTNPGTLTLDPIAGDNVLTPDEAAAGLVISGSSHFMVMPLDVQVTINGVTHSFSDYTNDWAVTFTPQELAGLPDGPLTVTVTAYDLAGNLITATAPLTVELGDLQPLTFDPFGGSDNYLDEDELESDQLLSGQAENNPAGSIVTLTLGGFTYQAEVQADHSWSVLIPSEDLKTLPNDPTTDILGSITDAGGNLLAVGSHSFLLYRTPGQLNIDTLAGDGTLTADEANAPLVISGTITNGQVGAAVTVDLNGHLYQTTVTASDGSWSVTVPVADLALLGNTGYWVSATSTDLSGNEISGLNLLTVDLSAPVITLDPIAGDNIINAAEAAAGVAIGGHSSEAGGTVNLLLNGVTYNAAVNDEGNWRVTLPKSTLAALEDGRYTLTVSQTDANGHTTTLTESLLLDADPANRPVLRIHKVSGDNVLNGAEIQSDQIISGSSENVESGQTLSLKVGGVTYTTQVQAGGVWSLVVPAEALAALGNGGETLRASVMDTSGNRATASRNITIKSHHDGLSIDPVTGDNLINAAEAGGAITVTGHTDGVQRGATVHLTLNGEHYTAKVGRDGSWSVKLPAADVAVLEEGSSTLKASVKGAGWQILHAKAVLTVDTSAPELAFNPVTGDNRISHQEAQAGFALAGSTGIAAAGLLVLVVLNGVEYHAMVQESGNWAVAIPAGALAEQPAGDYPLTVSLADVAGNLTSITHTLALEAAPDAADSDAARAVAGQAVVADTADNTLTAALLTPDAATPEHSTYAIGGQTLDLTHSGGEATGGSGNDTIVLHTLDFLHIDGGSGTDTLLLAGTDQHLDLTALGLKIENIDIFDLGQSGSNSLTLGLHEAETVRDQPEESLFIRGAEGSQLTLAGDGSTWETSGQRTVDGLLFDVYHHGALESGNALGDLLVQHGIQVQQV
ncbi:Ig-like domain-containing protein [Chimaeribacter californicus]|nr:Ig-like domain-containing protein [Chimaeribacter californicus]